MGTEVGRGGLRNAQKGEASPGHVTDIGAREEPGILTGAGRQHILERSEMRLESRGPGSWPPGPLGAPAVQGTTPSAPGAAAGCTASQRDKKSVLDAGHLRASLALPKHSEDWAASSFKKINFCKTKEEKTHKQASENTQKTD